MAAIIEFPGRAQLRRKAIEAIIESLIDLLDGADAALAELEPGADDEDSCDAELESWAEWRSSTTRRRGGVRRPMVTA